MFRPNIFARIKKPDFDLRFFIERRNKIGFIEIAGTTGQSQIVFAIVSAARARKDMFNFKRKIKNGFGRAAIFADVFCVARNKRIIRIHAFNPPISSSALCRAAFNSVSTKFSNSCFSSVERVWLSFFAISSASLFCSFTPKNLSARCF